VLQRREKKFLVKHPSLASREKRMLNSDDDDDYVCTQTVEDFPIQNLLYKDFAGIKKL